MRRYTDEYVRTVIDGYGEKSARFRYLFSRLRETALVIVENVLDELEMLYTRTNLFSCAQDTS